jgi:hypothetical protein
LNGNVTDALLVAPGVDEDQIIESVLEYLPDPEYVVVRDRYWTTDRDDFVWLVSFGIDVPARVADEVAAKLGVRVLTFEQYDAQLSASS